MLCPIRHASLVRRALAVDTLGHLLAVLVTLASAQQRAQVAQLTAAAQEVTGQTVELAFIDQGYTGEMPAAAAAQQGTLLEVVKLSDITLGFVSLPRRWVVERSCVWASRFLRLAKDDQRLPDAVAGLPYYAFVCLMLHRVVTRGAQSPRHATPGCSAENGTDWWGPRSA